MAQSLIIQVISPIYCGYHRQLNAISLRNGSFYSFSTEFPPLVSEMLGAALFEMDGIYQAGDDAGKHRRYPGKDK